MRPCYISDARWDEYLATAHCKHGKLVKASFRTLFSVLTPNPSWTLLHQISYWFPEILLLYSFALGFSSLTPIFAANKTHIFKTASNVSPGVNLIVPDMVGPWYFHRTILLLYFIQLFTSLLTITDVAVVFPNLVWEQVLSLCLLILGYSFQMGIKFLPHMIVLGCDWANRGQGLGSASGLLWRMLIRC